MDNDYEKYDGLMMDVVGKKGETIPYRKAIENGMSYVRFVMGFFENDAGQLFIPRRSSSDARFPGQLDVSVRHPVSSGENYKQTVDHFFKNALSCDPLSLNIELIGHGDPIDRIRTSVFTDVYRARLNSIPEQYAARFSDSGFFHPQDLFDRILKGDPATDDLKQLFVNLYWNKFRELRFADLLDFDPEEKIFELAVKCLAGCKESESVEDARDWAEDKVKQEIQDIVKETQKNYPALSPLFSNIYKRHSHEELLDRSPERGAIWIETQGVWPFFLWPEEKRFEWCEAVAKKAGIVFRRYIYKREFICDYRGRNDYRAAGSKFKSIELPGREPSEPNRELSSVGNSITIRRSSEREDDRETETTTVRIYDKKILPVMVKWTTTDVYSGYSGTSGSSEWHTTEISLSENGEVQVK